jgi:carotenoid cleavage dioxygenase-like enzyme
VELEQPEPFGPRALKRLRVQAHCRHCSCQGLRAGHRRAFADGARAHRSSDCGSSTGGGQAESFDRFPGLLAEALGEKWPAGPVHADMDFVANTHIIAHAGRFLATVEAGSLPYKLSGELETLM